MDNVTVILLNGTHELNSSMLVRKVNDFTLLGAGGITGKGHVKIICNGVSSLVFEGITNLTITRIAFSQCGVFNHRHWLAPYRNALIFSDVINLKVAWVVMQNCSDAILAINVLGTSVIKHSSFHGLSYSREKTYNRTNHIYIWYKNRILHKHSNKSKSLLHAKLYIHNCVLRNGGSGSMKITLYHDGYNVEVVGIMNITALNGGIDFGYKSDIFINIGQKANYLVTIRDSYISNSKAAAITVKLFPPKAYISQVIRITNSVIDRSGTGIRIHYLYSRDINITFIPQITIENCIIMNIHHANHHWKKEDGLLIYRESEFPLSVILSNVSFENNQLSSYMQWNKDSQI